ncbi:Uncharacterised protein [Orientia tsutsugamushi]|nr:Uncharacterised protein [Orientia tsutsugamushi]
MTILKITKIFIIRLLLEAIPGIEAKTQAVVLACLADIRLLSKLENDVEWCYKNLI